MNKPFRGVWNIVRFNWPFYVLSATLALLMFLGWFYLTGPAALAAGAVLLVTAALTLISLLVSWYVYDLSGLYELNWLDRLPRGRSETVVNISAGFDETSSLLEKRLDGAEIIACDFYDPARHTAASIKRARRAYPPFPNTRKISTSAIPLVDGSADKIFTVLAAHEIRTADERALFFNELNRVLTPQGEIIVVEHLRDAANYAAYNIGALHFHSRSSWLATFRAARLSIESEVKITPFITAFFLSKNGTAP